MTAAIAPTESAIGTSWEELTSAGQEAAKHMDTGRWLLGDLAQAVKATYGEDKLGQYASLVSVKAQTLRGYERVSSFYARGELSRPEYENLSWSHYRAAMRLKDTDAALDFLKQCADETLTVESAEVELIKRLGKPVPPRKLFEGNVRVLARNQLGTLLTIPNETDLKPRIRIVIYEEST
jgi:hypothetical protein